MDRPPHALDWHYTVAGTNYEVFVLDTRTWRGYAQQHAFPALLSNKAFPLQIPPNSGSGKSVTIVVSPAPVFGVPALEAVQAEAADIKEKQSHDTEAWTLDRLAIESLLAALALGGNIVLDEGLTTKNVRRVVFLSGDVHFGFTARMQYWATKPFLGGFPTQIVAAHLTSSSLRNETSRRDATGPQQAVEKTAGATFTLHSMGYAPSADLPLPLKAVGWKNEGGQKQAIGKLRRTSISTITGSEIKADDQRSGTGSPVVEIWGGEPSLFAFVSPNQNRRSELVSVDKLPEWSYRVDYLLADHEVEDSPAFEPVDVDDPPSADRLKALREYLKAAKNRGDYIGKFGQGKEIVGVNNIGEVTFQLSGGDDMDVIHNLWWRLTTKKVLLSEALAETDLFLAPFPLSRWVVSMRFNDSRYAEVSLPVQP
jgi:hypothetical protein